MLPSNNTGVSLETCDVFVGLKPHLRCSKCTALPLDEPLYTCYLGHITCNSCRGKLLSATPTRQEMESDYEYNWRVHGVCLCRQCGGVTKRSNYIISKNTLTLEKNEHSETLPILPTNIQEVVVPNISEQKVPQQRFLNNTLVKSLWTTAQTNNDNGTYRNDTSNAQPQVTDKQNPVCTQLILTPTQFATLTSMKRLQVPQFNTSYLKIGDKLSNSVCCLGVPHSHTTAQEFIMNDNIILNKQNNNSEIMHHNVIPEGFAGKFITMSDLKNVPFNKNADAKLQIPVMSKITYLNSNTVNSPKHTTDSQSRNVPDINLQDNLKTRMCNNLQKQNTEVPQNDEHEIHTNAHNSPPHTHYMMYAGIHVNQNTMEQGSKHSDAQLSSANELHSSATILNYKTRLFKEEQLISQLILEKNQKICELVDQHENVTKKNESSKTVSKSTCDSNWSVNEYERKGLATPAGTLYCNTNLPKSQLHYKQVSPLVASNTCPPSRIPSSKIYGKPIQESPMRTVKVIKGDMAGNYKNQTSEMKSGTTSVTSNNRDSTGKNNDLPFDIKMNSGSASLSKGPPEPDTNIMNTVSYSDHKRDTSKQVIVLNSSHRPFLCPNTTCGQSISPFGVGSHMAFMHQSVPILNIDPGVPLHIWIKADQIPYNEATCILLILLAGRMRGPSVRKVDQLHLRHYHNRLALPLMVARLAVSVTLGHASETDDAVLVWLADVDSGSVIYTAGVTDRLSHSKSFTFRLPAYSLRSSQLPAEVYQQGDCIVLSSAMLNELCKTNGGFDIFLLVHSMDITQSKKTK